MCSRTSDQGIQGQGQNRTRNTGLRADPEGQNRTRNTGLREGPEPGPGMDPEHGPERKTGRTRCHVPFSELAARDEQRQRHDQLVPCDEQRVRELVLGRAGWGPTAPHRTVL